MHRYLTKLNFMKITEKTEKSIKKLQGGGTATPVGGEGQANAGTAPTDGQTPAQDPIEQIMQLAAQAVQARDGEAALVVCQSLLDLAQGGQGGGAPAPEGQPVYGKGGKLVRRKKD